MSFNDFVISFFSLSIQTWDLVEAVYHVVVFGILTALWFWVLVTRLPRNQALLVSVGIAVVLGTVTEIGQYFVHRSSLMFDAMADYLGVALCVVWLNSLNQS
jgi:VanZ family protein